MDSDLVIDIAGAAYAETYQIDDPGVFSDDDLIRAELRRSHMTSTIIRMTILLKYSTNSQNQKLLSPRN